MIQQKITEIAEILGWSVDFSEPQNGKTDVNFAKYTSYGQDFNFSVELEDDDMEAFIDNIHEYYENFDVDEEAYIWIGSDGHGKNGAPYHIADIVKDYGGKPKKRYKELFFSAIHFHGNPLAQFNCLSL